MNPLLRFRAVGLLAVSLTVAPFVFAADVSQDGASRDFMVTMRDGVGLATTVYFPEGDGPFPIVLTRTPYDKKGYGARSDRYTDEGFVFVAQDCRGRFASEGDYVPFEDDMWDGYDTVEWLAAQSFSDGKIGMTGASAMGITSNLAAAANPPHLTAAYVVVAPQSLFYESRFIGGVFKESHAGGWMRSQGVPEQVPLMKKRVVMDEQWKRTDLIHHLHKIDIPIYNVGGWYDIFIRGNIANYMYLQDKGLVGARGNQKLLLGPFGHGQLSGDLEYPDAGSLRSGADEIRWFEYWLKGVDNGIMEEPAVRYYMMASARKGATSAKNEWFEASSWPPASTETRFYLHSDRSLSTERPTGDDASTTFPFDPENPVPTFGGLNLRIDKGPMDQRAIPERDDYLRFETPILEEDLVVAGPMRFEFWASTDGLDTDFMVKLVDVYPDGYEAIVMDNPIRARFRHGREAGDVAMMTPGKAEPFTIDLWSTARVFEKGHRLAVHFTSSNFPRFEVNANTGEAPGEMTIPPRIARNTLFYNETKPSALVLPVLASTPE